MFKKVLIAVAILIASPALVSAQDIFWSFSPTELVDSASFSANDPCDHSLNPSDDPFYVEAGSVYIFSDGLFGWDGIDLAFTTSGSSVIRFTGGQAFNPTFTSIGGAKFELSEISIDSAANSGRLIALSVLQNGVDPVLGPLYDPGFAHGVGPNGAVLLARVDFEIVGQGTTELELTLGHGGISPVLNPSFGSATLARIPPHVGFCPNDYGDLDYNGVVDFGDIAPFIVVLQSGFYEMLADMNSDGAVDFNDIPPFIDRLAQ